MNNRLSEIAETIIASGTYINFDAFVQEFGKLIVEEASVIVDASGDREWREIGTELKQHFGLWNNKHH